MKRVSAVRKTKNIVPDRGQCSAHTVGVKKIIMKQQRHLQLIEGRGYGEDVICASVPGSALAAAAAAAAGTATGAVTCGLNSLNSG